MRGVCNKHDFALAKIWGAALLQLIWAHTEKFVLIRLGVSRQDLLVARRLTLDELFPRKSGIVAVSNPPETIVRNLSGHVPVCWVADEVGVPEAEFLIKWEVNLDDLSNVNNLRICNLRLLPQFADPVFRLGTLSQIVQFLHRSMHHQLRRGSLQRSSLFVHQVFLLWQ